MTKTEYNTMQAMYKTSHMQAWEYILDNWACKEWRSIPSEIKSILGLHPAIGICSGMLVTRTGASGLDEFITKMNRKRSD